MKEDKYYEIYERERIEKWNRDMNGCSESTSECKYNKIMIVYNEAVDSLNDFNIILADNCEQIQSKALHLRISHICVKYLRSFPACHLL